MSDFNERITVNIHIYTKRTIFIFSTAHSNKNVTLIFLTFQNALFHRGGGGGGGERLTYGGHG